MRRVGLVHGRFQPLHKGHVGLIDQALAECDHVVVLLSVDNQGPWSMLKRWSMLRAVYPDPRELIIGANLPLFAREIEPNWEILFTSCVITAAAVPPTDVYVGPDYSVIWSSGVTVHRHKQRIHGCSGTGIRELLAEGNIDAASRLVPPQVMQIILESDAVAQAASCDDGS